MSVEVEIDVETSSARSRRPTRKSPASPRPNSSSRPAAPGRSTSATRPTCSHASPDGSAESFAGVANPFSLGQLEPGEDVLDLGSGAGTDSLVAAQMVGEEGSVTGVDMTPEMIAKASASAGELGVQNVEFLESEAERLPFADRLFDVVISNGVIDLIPDKDAVFAELFRVLKPGGRLQLADVTIQRPVSEEGRRNIDLWTG